MSNALVVAQTFLPGSTSFRARIQAQAIAYNGSEHITIGFDTEVNYTDTPSQINAALRNAAVAQFALIDPPVTVGSDDQVRILGGCV